MDSRGFSLIEVLAVTTITGFMASMAAPMITESAGRFAVNSASTTFTARYAMTRTLAIREGARSRLTLDPSTGRFWVDIDTSLNGTGDWQPAMAAIDVSEDRVSITTSATRFCFDARGLAVGGTGCDTGAADVVFASGGHSQSVHITALGKVLR